MGNELDLSKYEPWLDKGNYKVYHTNGEGFPLYSEFEDMTKTPAGILVGMHDSGMACTHNYPCPVCKNNHAVLSLSAGVFVPCHTCQLDGYDLVKHDLNSFWYKLIKWWES